MLKMTHATNIMSRPSMKAARRLSTATLPQSPLSSYLSATASSSSLRTGFTHNFALSSNIDRSAAAAFRQRCRNGSFSGQTSGVAPGFVRYAAFSRLPVPGQKYKAKSLFGKTSSTVSTMPDVGDKSAVGYPADTAKE